MTSRRRFAIATFLMITLSRILLLLIAVTAPALAQRKIGDVRVDVDANTIPIRISANNAELQTLALTAFDAHGRYKRVGSGHAYEFKFTAITPTQVRVDITRGAAGTPVASELANGTTARHALLRAADIAVQKTNGMNQRGFFTARLAFIVQRSGQNEIYVSDLFLGEARRLSAERAPVISPRWAPDGSRVIYTSYHRTGAPDIYLHDPV